MGKLIKNHWARLIVLTAATCTHSTHSSSISLTLVTNFFFSRYRPNRRRDRRLLLAQILLRLAHQELRRRSQADPYSPNNQPRLRSPQFGRGVAFGLLCRHIDPEEHGTAHAVAAADEPGECVIIPRHESCSLLSDCVCGIFLGVQ